MPNSAIMYAGLMIDVQPNPPETKFTNFPEKVRRPVSIGDKYNGVKARAEEFSSHLKNSFDGLTQKAPQDVDLGEEKLNVDLLVKRLDTLDKDVKKKLSNSELPLTPEDYAPFSKESVEKIFDKPERTTYTTVVFEAKDHNGEELIPGKRMLYQIPTEYRGRVIRDVILKHRKDPSRSSGDQWDSEGAYSRVLVRDGETGQWEGWVDPAGYGSDKFAEPRSAYDPENEVLHDWVTTVGEVHPSVVSVENVGKGNKAISNIHGLEVIFFPEAGKAEYQEQVFSPGTEFVDIDKGKLEPNFGGGPGHGGKYPGAVALRGYRRESETVTLDKKTTYFDERGRMHIKLQPGKKFLGLELAVGDTHPDGIPNKDGHTGTPGWAKIYAGLISPESRSVQYFMENVNVPPAGVLAGGPEQVERLINKGEEIVLESRADTAYLMGYRITYKD